MLVRGLPPDAAVVRGKNPEATWDDTKELLATLVEVQDYGNRMFHAAHQFRGSPTPIRIPRPWEKKKREDTTAELRDFFGSAIRYAPGTPEDN